MTDPKKTRMLKYVNDWIDSRLDVESLKILMHEEITKLKKERKEIELLKPNLNKMIQGQPSKLEYLPKKFIYGSDVNLHELALLLEVYVPRDIRIGRRKP